MHSQPGAHGSHTSHCFFSSPISLPLKSLPVSLPTHSHMFSKTKLQNVKSSLTRRFRKRQANNGRPSQRQVDGEQVSRAQIHDQELSNKVKVTLEISRGLEKIASTPQRQAAKLLNRLGGDRPRYLQTHSRARRMVFDGVSLKFRGFNEPPDRVIRNELRGGRDYLAHRLSLDNVLSPALNVSSNFAQEQHLYHVDGLKIEGEKSS